MRVTNKAQPALFPATSRPRRVVKLQRVRDVDTGEEGTVIKSLGGFWKVKWDNRTRTTLIDPDQVRKTNPAQRRYVMKKNTAKGKGPRAKNRPARRNTGGLLPTFRTGAAAKTATKKNLFGLGPKAKRKRKSKARRRVAILEARAALLRARAMNSAKGAAKGKGQRAKNPKSKYTLWGGQLNSQGERVWGVNERRYNQLYNISGRGYYTRADAMAALKKMRAEERDQAATDRYYAKEEGKKKNPDRGAVLQAAVKRGLVKIQNGKFVLTSKGRTELRQKNPPIWADILGGFVGGVGSTLARYFVEDKVLKRKAKKANSAKGKAGSGAGNTRLAARNPKCATNRVGVVTNNASRNRLSKQSKARAIKYGSFSIEQNAKSIVRSGMRSLQNKRNGRSGISNKRNHPHMISHPANLVIKNARETYVEFYDRGERKRLEGLTRSQAKDFQERYDYGDYLEATGFAAERAKGRSKKRAAIAKARRASSGRAGRRTPTRKANTASTARQYREFHGREPSGKVINGYFGPAGMPKDVSPLGPIVDIELEDGPYSKLTFLPKLANATHITQQQLLAAYPNAPAYLVQAQRGPHRRLYVVVRKPHTTLPNGEVITRTLGLGNMKAVTYVARKPHLYGEASGHFMHRHAYGDRGGRRPSLYVNAFGMIEHRGGDYNVRAEGIDN